MTPITSALSIDLDQEIEAMASYIATRWEGVPEPKQLFTLVRDIALHDARFMFDDMDVSEVLRNRDEARQALLTAALTPEEVGQSIVFDQPRRRMMDLWMAMPTLKSCAQQVDGPWDYGKRCDKAYYRALDSYPELSRARPLGWAELRKGYSDFDGMEEYCHTEQRANEAAFQGHDSASYNTSGFTRNTALPYVMYDEVCQGRRAPYTLVSAVYGHFLLIRQKRNIEAFVAAIDGIDWKDATPAIVFDVPVETDYPLLKAALDMAYPEGIPSAEQVETDYLQAVKVQREFLAKPQEERDRIHAENNAELEAMLRGLLDGMNEPMPPQSQQELDKVTRCLAMLRTGSSGPAHG